VIERHLLWTLPDPPAALRAWRAVAPGGRLVSYEGIWGLSGIARDLRRLASSAIRAVRRIPPDHHAEYDLKLRSSLPLAGRMGPEPVVQALSDSGWRRYRLERLRDVEWARRLAAPWPLGWVDGMAHFALIAEA
jgi:hypothetical protein